MKTTLNKDEVALLKEVKNEYIKNGLSKLPINQEKLVKGINFVYGLLKLSPPAIVVCKSPLDLLKQAQLRGAKIEKGETFDYFGLGYDSGWTSFYDYFKRIGIKYEDDKFDKWLMFMQSGVWATFLFDTIAFVCAGPDTVKKNAENRLHNTSGPATTWGEDLQLYFLNGVGVTKELVMTPAEKLDPKIILTEKNADVRREIVRKIGVERVIAKLGAKVIDMHGDYELLSLDIGDKNYRPYLKMKNPSIGVYHIEGVHPSIKTVKEALAWRNDTDIEPTILT